MRKLVLAVTVALAAMSGAAAVATPLNEIVGTPGNDVLGGGPGPDVIKAKGGDDRLWGGKGPDTFFCGPGYDVVHNLKGTGNDVIAPSCEKVVTE